MALTGIARVEFVFEQRGYGWTEQYFIADSTGSLTVAIARSLILQQKRRVLLGLQGAITFRSVSDAGGQRAGQTFPVPFADGVGTYENSDKEATALLFKRVDATGHNKSSIFLRGVPDVEVTNGGLYTPGPNWLTDFPQYQTELVVGGWGWLGKDGALSGRANITGVVADGQLRPVFTLDAAVLPVGPPLPKIAFRVAGVQGAGNLNNTWVGQVLSGTTLRTLKPVPFFPVLPNTGHITFRGLKFIQIANSNVQRVVTRHAGRPLYHSAGRAKAQARG